MPSIALRLRTNRFLANRFSRKIASQELARPIVSFTFDDFPRSALMVAGKVLIDHGVRGTYYASMGLMGRTTEVGKLFEPSDLIDLVASGHELACHTFDHTACDRLTYSELLNTCEKNRRMVAEMLSGYRLRNFAFPFGAVTLSAKSALASIYSTCRGIESGINRNFVDLAFLRTYGYESVDTLKEVIRENVHLKGWLILYTHDVSVTHSKYGCTPESFLEVLRYAIESGAEVLTVAEATRRFNSANTSGIGNCPDDTFKEANETRA
jgi:peptidoglycan/xylan/chitin deacetylase (PgdA/CDA1 family)